jgi:hypothetical protein
MSLKDVVTHRECREHGIYYLTKASFDEDNTSICSGNGTQV